MKWQSLLTLLMVCFWPFLLNADSKIRVLKSDWCPYVCIGTSHLSTPGYVTEIIQQILANNGYYIEFVEMNFARGMYLLEQGKLDLILTIFKDEAGLLKLNKTPVTHSKNYFYTLKNAQWKFENITSLSRVKFGVVNGYDYLNEALNDYIYNNQDANITIVSGSQAQKRLLKLLKRRRIDTFLDDLLVVNYQLTQLKQPPDVRIAGKTQNAEPIFVGVSPYFPKHKELLARIDIQLKKLLDSPLHEKIHTKYQSLVGIPQLSGSSVLANTPLQLKFDSLPPLTAAAPKTDITMQE